MNKKISKTEYQPDYISPPGETLLETLKAIGMSQAELAKRLGRPKKMVNEIIKGKAPISAETAIQLERVTGIPAAFWSNRERAYREYLVRQNEKQRLQQHLSWLDNFPLKEMIKLGWLKKSRNKLDLLTETLNFFGVASPESWTIIYKKNENAFFKKSPSYESNNGAVAAWLRRGEIEAQATRCAPYSKIYFKKNLLKIRSLTRKSAPEFLPELRELCAECGVVTTFIPELPKTRLFGATWWLSPDKAVIQLSLRYKSDDHLWFSFFHEAAHIILHGKRLIFLESESPQNVKEEEANNFASNWLIPKEQYENFVKHQTFNRSSINCFADEMEIAPGIVVGRLQHDNHLRYNQFNELKTRLKWSCD